MIFFFNNTNQHRSLLHPDSEYPPAPTLIPTTLSKPVDLGGVTYRVVEKRLDWTGALHLCESLNGSLASVKTPFEQAHLTLLINSLHRPAWISLYNYGVSSSVFGAAQVSLWGETADLLGGSFLLRVAALLGWEKTRWLIPTGKMTSPKRWAGAAT